MTRVLVLGAGMVGSAIAMDLAAPAGEFRVTVADRDAAALERLAGRFAVQTHCADMGDPVAVTALARGFDIVIGAMPSRMGLQTLRAVIDAGTNYVDISFMADDPMTLHEHAKRRGVVAIVDCGVGPGMSNMMAGYAASVLDPCRRLEIYVGGLPVERRWPYEYKAAFAPSDVIEEYVRPARIVQDGRVVVRP